jgi:hypothetical protein
MAWKSALHSLLESAPLTQYWYVSLVCIVRKSYWLYDAYLTREVGPVNEMCGALLLRPPQTDRASSSPSLIWDATHRPITPTSRSLCATIYSKIFHHRPKSIRRSAYGRYFFVGVGSTVYRVKPWTPPLPSPLFRTLTVFFSIAAFLSSSHGRFLP